MPQKTPTPTTQTTTRTNAPVRPAPTRTNQSGPEVLVQRALADPSSLSAQDVVLLQRHLGNHAVQGLLARPSAPVVQRATAGDAEAEMEPVLPEAQAVEASVGGAPATALPVAPPDEDPLQRQAAGSLALAGGPVTPDLEQRVQRARGSGQPLPAPVRARMEGAFHTDFSSVKIHTDAEAHTLNRSLGARAFTTGADVFFKAGEYQPHASGGQELLAHELTHVVQQGGALRRKPNFMDDSPTKLGSPAIQRAGETAPTTTPTAPAPPTTPAPTRPPGPGPTPSAGVTIPSYPTILTEAEWKKHKGLAAKLGRDPIGIQLGIVASAHRGVVWNRFDVGRFPPASTPVARQSVSTAEAARAARTRAAAAKLAAKSASPAALRAASRALDTAKDAYSTAQTAAKAAADEADTALGFARAEYSGNVMLILAQAHMLSNELQKQSAKSDHLGQMAAAAAQYARQVDSVKGAFAVYEQARATAKALAAEAQAALVELYKEDEDETETPEIEPLLDLDEDEDLTDETETEETEEVQAPTGQVQPPVVAPVTEEEETVESESGEVGPVPTTLETETTDGDDELEEETVTDVEDLDEDLEEETTEVTAPTLTQAPRTRPGPMPLVPRLPNPTVTIPAFPTMLTEADWKNHRGLAAKLGRDSIGIQLGIVSSAHRGVVWNRFDIGRFPPGATPVARRSEEAAVAARAAVSRAQGYRAVSEAKELLHAAEAAAKAAVEEADTALGFAQAEYKNNVMLILGQTHMLSNALLEKSAKSPHLSAMAAVAAQYARQVDSVKAAYAAFEQARDYARELEVEAQQSLEALIEEEEAGSDPFASSLDLDEPEAQGGPTAKPVPDIVGRKFFAELSLIRFYKEREVQDWVTSRELTISAKDSKTPNTQLVSLQTKAKNNRNLFKDSVLKLTGLTTQVMPPDRAAKAVNDLWKKAITAYVEPAGFTGNHREWERIQRGLAGSQGKFEEWQGKFTKATALHEKVGELLLDELDHVESVTEEVEQIAD